MCIEYILHMAKDDILLLLDIDDTIFNTDTFKKSQLTQYSLFEDVQDALQQLHAIATLGILSQGEKSFQVKKLQETQIHPYFIPEHTHIFEDKAREYKQLFARYHNRKKVIFVEDRIASLAKAKQADLSIVAVWMKRGRYAHHAPRDISFHPDYTVTTLHDLSRIIHQIDQ